MKKIIFVMAAVAVSASPLLAYAAVSFTAAPTTAASGNENSISFTYASQSSGVMRFYLFDNGGNNVSGNSNADHADGASPISWQTAGLATGQSPSTYTVVGVDPDGIVGGNTDSVCGAGQTLGSCSGSMNPNYIASQSITITPGPTLVPSVASSDIAAVGGPVLGAFIYPAEWVLENFGPPLFVILLVFAVFFAIYHRVKVGRWL